MSFHPPRRTLMGPGPSDVYPRVTEALSRPTIGHLDPEFIGLMNDIKRLLQYAFQTENELTLPVSAPGSAGMEACFVNLLEPGDKVIICQNGVFGARMQENVVRCGAEAVMVQDEWGTAIDLDKAAAAVAAHPDAKVLAFVHAETSTGVRSDAGALCALARDAGMLSIMDTVTGLGGIEVAVDAWGADAVYSGTQKCLSCVPGLSPVSFSERAAERHPQPRQSPVQSWFLDMNLVMGYWGGQRQARLPPHRADQCSLRPARIPHHPAGGGAGERVGPGTGRNHEALESRAGSHWAWTCRWLQRKTTGCRNSTWSACPEGVDDAAVRSNAAGMTTTWKSAPGLGTLAGSRSGASG